jgi:hypothetical protein
MRSNSFFVWFFIIGGCLTAIVGAGYFITGEAGHGTEQQSYQAGVQIALGVVSMLLGLRRIEDKKKPTE